MREQLRGLGLGVLFVGGLLYGQAAMACTTQAGTRENQKNTQQPIDLTEYLVRCLAERTGLEPATLGVTGRYSNQLNYRSRYCIMRVTA